MVRYVIIAFAIFSYSGTLNAQEVHQADSFQNTVQVNLMALPEHAVEFIYTRSITPKFNGILNAGYTYADNRNTYDIIRNLTGESTQGYFFKAGVELPKYYGEKGRGSFALFGIYGRGKVEHFVEFAHPLGVYEQSFPANYAYYGAGGSGSIRVLRLGEHWFMDTALEFNICRVNTDAYYISGGYPGIGFSNAWKSDAWGMGTRLHLRIGYNF